MVINDVKFCARFFDKIYFFVYNIFDIIIFLFLLIILMLENRKLNDIKTDIQSDKEYKYLLSEIDSEIAELTDEDVNNDGFELD
ncbi:hypothetical protein J5751_00115 [bacterium]|nr:hypothetical protein [bacterium]